MISTLRQASSSLKGESVCRVKHTHFIDFNPWNAQIRNNFSSDFKGSKSLIFFKAFVKWRLGLFWTPKIQGKRLAFIAMNYSLWQFIQQTKIINVSFQFNTQLLCQSYIQRKANGSILTKNFLGSFKNWPYWKSKFDFEKLGWRRSIKNWVAKWFEFEFSIYRLSTNSAGAHPWQEYHQNDGQCTFLTTVLLLFDWQLHRPFLRATS